MVAGDSTLVAVRRGAEMNPARADAAAVATTPSKWLDMALAAKSTGTSAAVRPNAHRRRRRERLLTLVELPVCSLPKAAATKP